MSQYSLPSLRLVLFTLQPLPVLDTLTETLGQQISLIVVAPNPFLIYQYQGIVAHSHHKQNVLVVNDMHQLPAILNGLAPDLILSLDFPLPFPRELLALPRLGCVNVHPSLLPKYRGPRPVFWQFLHGETHSGLTFHRMENDAYSGPILLQRELTLAPDDDARSMWANVLQLELSMLPEALTMVAEGAPGIPQPEGGESLAPMLGAEERQLDWTRPATHLHNQIRALALEGAHALIDGQGMRVFRSSVVCAVKASASPGTLLACTTEGMLMQTGQDALMVTKYAYEDQIGQFFLSQKQ
jgi:methionyl-tRNA formyltransferase